MSTKITNSSSVVNCRSASQDILFLYLFGILIIPFSFHRLGLDSLVGTPALKPYMHGYFVSLRLYDAARVIANPFVYEEHREKLVKDKMGKLAESRIRSRKDNANLPKVNRRLAEKILEEEARKQKREERRKEKAAKEPEAMDVDENQSSTSKSNKTSFLTDERFKALFEIPISK